MSFFKWSKVPLIISLYSLDSDFLCKSILYLPFLYTEDVLFIWDPTDLGPVLVHLELMHPIFKFAIIPGIIDSSVPF